LPGKAGNRSHVYSVFAYSLQLGASGCILYLLSAFKFRLSAVFFTFAVSRFTIAI
jgi:hypothetical protein